MTRLRDLCQVNPGVPQWDRLDDHDLVPFLPMERVWTDHLDVSELRPKHEVASGYTRFAERDLLLPKITPTFEAGRAAVAVGLNGGVGTGTTELHVLRPNSRVHPRWLLHFLNSETFLRRGHADMYGVAGQKRISADFVKSYPVEPPPLEDQQRVADYLDAETARIDELIAEEDHCSTLTLERFEAWREAQLLDSSEARLVPLHYLVDPERPIVYGIVQAGPEVEGGVPYIKTGDVENLRLDRLSRTSPAIDAQYIRARVRPGDIVIAMRASIGAVVQIPVELPHANLTQGTARIAPSDRRDVDWLLQTIRTRFVQGEAATRAVGSTFRTLNIGDLKRLPIPVPPPAVRQALGRQVSAVEAEANAFLQESKHQRALLRERRQALITHAVTHGIEGLPGVA